MADRKRDEQVPTNGLNNFGSGKTLVSDTKSLLGLIFSGHMFKRGARLIRQHLLLTLPWGVVEATKMNPRRLC